MLRLSHIACALAIAVAASAPASAAVLLQSAAAVPPPEPATPPLASDTEMWAAILIGFVLLGTLLRRSRPELSYVTD